jgi:hypothetical protein
MNCLLKFVLFYVINYSNDSAQSEQDQRFDQSLEHDQSLERDQSLEYDSLEPEN